MPESRDAEITATVGRVVACPVASFPAGRVTGAYSCLKGGINLTKTGQATKEVERVYVFCDVADARFAQAVDRNGRPA